MIKEDGEHLPEEERQGDLQHNLEHPGGLQDHDTRGFIEDPVAGTVEELEQDNADEHQENIDEQGALEHEQGALEHEEEEVMIEEEPDPLVQIKTEIVSQGKTLLQSFLVHCFCHLFFPLEDVHVRQKSN